MPAARYLRSAAAVLAIVGLAASAGACDGDGGAATGPEAFCDRLREAQPEMAAVTDSASASATADRFVALSAHAPEEIRAEWDQLTQLFRTVAALNPADPGFREAVLAETGRTITAAAEVNAWVQQRCGFDLTAATLTPVTTLPASTAPGVTPGSTTGATVPVVTVQTSTP